MLFLFPSFSEAALASETANACFNIINSSLNSTGLNLTVPLIGLIHFVSTWQSLALVEEVIWIGPEFTCWGNMQIHFGNPWAIKLQTKIMRAQPEPYFLSLCGIAPFTIFKWTNKAFTSSDLKTELESGNTTWLQVIFKLSTHLVLLVKLLTLRQPSKMGWNCMTNEGLYSLIIKNLSCFSLFASAFSCYLGSGQRYMICVTLCCTLHESKNLLPCENRVLLSHGCRFFY